MIPLCLIVLQSIYNEIEIHYTFSRMCEFEMRSYTIPSCVCAKIFNKMHLYRAGDDTPKTNPTWDNLIKDRIQRARLSGRTDCPTRRWRANPHHHPHSHTEPRDLEKNNNLIYNLQQ